MATALHQARFNAVIRELLADGARHVADLGCGRGELLQRLREHRQFTRLIGVDTDIRALARARMVLGIDLLRPDPDLHVCLHSFTDAMWPIPRVDAGVMLETIEHVDPGHLPQVEQAVFGRLRPRMLVMTTPNREYNRLHGLSPGQRRRPDHRFEWTRAQFQQWCTGVAQRQRYDVRFADIGPSHPAFGSSSQLARFSLAA
ncbi:methyltransferase domain-containing protein [Salinisphaera sp. P385]|uniref:Small RNA 2'-O-methyltransferase n=1 Tax=Spectribacter acetivorans TaxID=3075603 RepID=A0ABU3B5R8_9GAMM|nr:methyltransferase domain-containing protein [Salinisphaera sp. P385]MDT0617813.1 methyltransferase domain-containing protein [Salinisphaera sp. P385]